MILFIPCHIPAIIVSAENGGASFDNLVDILPEEKAKNKALSEDLIDYENVGMRSIEADLDQDGDEEIIKLFYEAKDEIEGDITLTVQSKDKIFGIRNVVTAPKNFCVLGTVVISEKIKPFISIYHPAGVHGVRQLLYSFDGKDLRQVANIHSDGPSIALEDVDSDGEKEIIVKQRDYEINPIEESFIETYKYTEKDGWKRVAVYRTATKKYMSEDWDKNETDIEAFKKNMKRFDMYEPEDWGE